jgi:hypothetical protein
LNLNISSIRDAGYTRIEIILEFGVRRTWQAPLTILDRLWVNYNPGLIQNNATPPPASRYHEFVLRPGANWETVTLEPLIIPISNFNQQGLTVHWGTDSNADYLIGHRVITVRALR